MTFLDLIKCIFKIYLSRFELLNLTGLIKVSPNIVAEVHLEPASFQDNVSHYDHLTLDTYNFKHFYFKRI